jgi:hypothetical protein
MAAVNLADDGVYASFEKDLINMTKDSKRTLYTKLKELFMSQKKPELDVRARQIVSNPATVVQFQPRLAAALMLTHGTTDPTFALAPTVREKALERSGVRQVMCVSPLVSQGQAAIAHDATLFVRARIGPRPILSGPQRRFEGIGQ